MSTRSRTPSLTPSRSPSPSPPVQPDHFYGSEGVPFPPSPNSDGKTWLDPEDDPLASRGIPVFKPTMEEFRDFEGYMTKIECWGSRSGIVKVIPPKEWCDALPPLTDQLAAVKLKNPIEQHMFGRGGLFRQQNMEKRRVMSVREWAELCDKEELRAPGVDDVGLHHASRNPATKTKAKRGKRKGDATAAESAEPDAEVDDDESKAKDDAPISLASPPRSEPTPGALADGDRPTSAEAIELLKEEEEEKTEDEDEGKSHKPKAKGRRQAPTREMREAHLAERASLDAAFLEKFDPDSDWLPPNTTPFDYTPEFCQKLERQFWRNCGLGKPAWYGADMAGSLFTDETKVWNVAHLPSVLDRILPSSVSGLPGVNTPYLYFGMWRATFAWHVEDMDLFSINYIHFGAGKFWYAVPQARSGALEQTMRGHFPEGPSKCPQFLRHKAYLASPTHLSQASCRPNTLVQNSGEFVITYPRGYHAGFNLGLNCAESVNFALDSWLELGRKAKVCNCVSDSVRIDVDDLLRQREAEVLLAEEKAPKPKPAEGRSAKPKSAETKKPSRKRKSDENEARKTKKAKTGPSLAPLNVASGSGASSPTKLTVKLKLGPKPKELEPFPCCLCVSISQDDLLPVQDPPTAHHAAYSETKVWMAHAICANVIPETWIDELDLGVREDGSPIKQRVVFGVDAIVKDRWNLKCSACSKNRSKLHGAPVQCTKGKCPKAFHVSCAREGGDNGILYQDLREVEKEVVVLGTPIASGTAQPNQMEVDGIGVNFRTVVSDAIDPLNAQTFKVVKKVEFLLLCSQHNPAITEAKKASKQDKIRRDLLALEPMARIKIRVSAGVFEVSLVRVVEETGSVEVLWDRGLKREFKWGSVVFGNLEGQTVLQKPAEAAPTPQRKLAFVDEPVPF
ncbi:JmjC-domain-containing protein [Artomyces pyxidatus]|uniref:JmjC-domain-containing protein n=1 Tax=Artomyces pyxidatus TaxID=48021 RepID=A0ACB8TAK7_9AGAM|nr:JmjC-domain-containing protein [Artomyces pyxidatus]